MAEAQHKFIAVEITSDGWFTGEHKGFSTQQEAPDGAKAMIRTAPQGHSIYAYKALARIDMDVTYDVTME